jgi:hypothetical protein
MNRAPAAAPAPFPFRDRSAMTIENTVWHGGIASDRLALIPVDPAVCLAGRRFAGQSAEAPHFLGLLIATSLLGALAGAAAVLSGLSILLALGIYSGVGTSLFGLSLIGRRLLSVAPSARPMA